MQFSSSDDHSVGSQSSQDSANGKITKRRKKGGLALSKNKSLQWYSLGGVILLICVLTSIRSTHFLVRQSKENDHAVLGLPLDQASKKITKGIVQHNQITKRVAQPMILAPNDFIYKVDWDSNWDSAPIVVERYKLVFFVIPKVACTVRMN